MSTADTSTLPVTRSPGFLRWALLIGLAALVVRVLIIVLVDPHVPEVGDAARHHLLANNLADGRGYIRPFDLEKFGRVVATAEYPPMFPFFLSLFARLGARSVEAQRLVMAVVGSGTVILVAFIGRRAGGTAVGIVAGVLAALYPMLFLAEATLMSESLFVFLVAAALLLAYAAADRPDLLRFVALGVVIGIATLTRAEAMVLAVFLVVPLVWKIRDSSVGRRVAMGALVFAVAVVVVVPWSVRNARTFDEFVPVSNSLVQIVDGANCRLTYSGPYLGSWRSTFGNADAHGTECFEGFNGSQPGFDEAKAAAVSRRDGLDYISAHLSDLPKVAAARLLRTFGLFRPAQQTQLEALEGRPLGWERAGTYMYWVLAPLAIGGLVVLIRRRATVWPLVAAVSTVVVSTVLTYGTQRFRITAEPAILVLAAAALVAIAERLRAWRGARRARNGRRHLNAGRRGGFRRLVAMLPTMLWLERQVVATLASDVDHRRRLALEGYVDGVLRAMPEHLRLGVAAESIVLGSGEWISRRLGSRRSLTDRIGGWEHSRIGPIRQYVRLLSSLVIFADEELAPETPAEDDE